MHDQILKTTVIHKSPTGLGGNPRLNSQMAKQREKKRNNYSPRKRDQEQVSEQQLTYDKVSKSSLKKAQEISFIAGRLRNYLKH